MGLVTRKPDFVACKDQPARLSNHSMLFISLSLLHYEVVLGLFQIHFQFIMSNLDHIHQLFQLMYAYSRYFIFLHMLRERPLNS